MPTGAGDPGEAGSAAGGPERGESRNAGGAPPTRHIRPARHTAGEYRQALRNALRGETKAYGFALVVWGTGALTTDARGQPGAIGAIAFVGGVLLAMALVLLSAFGRPPRTEERTREQHFGFGGIHVLAVPAALAVGWALAAAIHRRWPAYLAAGFGAATMYQLLLGLEVLLTPPSE